ncbi:MAG TPA: hypothetical protein VHM91_15365, partial [Verrucomicrobiales bacterium]|nr:hypothetical protein [Verrucomicrobiales bacterium]
MKLFPVSAPLLFASFFAWLPAAQAVTTVNAGTLTQISGPGGLDLAGEFTHAINFSSNDPALFINGVRFKPDTALPAGFTVGNNQVAPWGTKPAFGTDTDSDNLEQIFEDIRYCVPPGQSLQAHLPVTAGETYKIQILFYGNRTETRVWDIEIEGVQTVDEVTSLGLTGSVYSANAGLVYTHTVVAGDSTLDIRMGNFGGANDGGDRNALWQGLTVEHIVPDTDGDGLPDAWEIAKFGTITAQAGDGDADSDGLNNQYEYQLGTDPKAADTDGDGLSDQNEFSVRHTNPVLADSDGDGLNDGAEITAGSNPLVVDSDGDGLRDGAEVNVYGTSPVDTDSDNDNATDADEVAFGSSPTDANAYPLYGARTFAFSGGDQGDGLDLDGTFPVAARFGVSTLAGSWQVRDANFIPYHAVPGLVHNTTVEVGQWITAGFTAPLSTNDTNLREVIRSIRYNPQLVTISIPGLIVGRTYKLQLLFGEACCANRGFDVYVNNNLIVDEFGPAIVQGGQSNVFPRGAAIAYGFVADSTTIEIRLDKSTVTTPTLDDVNPIINALTIEEIATGPNTDGDSLPDNWEMQHFGNLAQVDSGDPDNDGLTNREELLHSTNPNDDDTDHDGLKDKVELVTHLTNPRVADTDRDGLSD